MDSALHDLIRQTKDNAVNNKLRSSDATHVSYIPQQQFITIRRNSFEDFWDGYCRLVYKGNGTYSLAEINDRDMPVLAALTFQFNRDNIGDKDIFTNKFLAELIFAWQRSIDAKLEISESRAELRCVVIESEGCWDEGNTTFHQVRLQFPLCKTEVNLISKIREHAISILRKRNSIKLLETTPENDWDKIIDHQAHLEPLLLYKSTRVNGRPKQTLTDVYGEITEEALDKEDYPTLLLATAFNPADHAYVSQGLINPDLFEDSTDANRIDPLYWLPLILSLRYSSSIILAKDETPRANVTDVTSFDEKTDQLTKAQYFLQFLKQDRAVDTFSWRDIGRALYTSSNGSPEGLKVWIDFTEQNDRFTRKDCEINWPRLEPDYQVTYRTIAWFAKKDSPEDYKAWHDKWCDEALEKALELHNMCVAEWLYRRYWLEVACASSDHPSWYVYNGTRWYQREKSVVLSEKITKEAIPYLEKLRIEVSNHVHTLVNKTDKITDEVRIKAITALIAKLSDQGSIGRIVAGSATFFHIEYEKFNIHADNNPNLMGCADCVIEADEDGLTIRPGKPEDYITMSTGVYLLRNRFSWDHPYVKETMDWIRKVHADEVQRQEFIKELASWLRGRNIEKRVPFWSGDKNNSKSMVIRGLELAFGQYMGKFPTSIFTGKRTQSSSATPELARTKGKRVMICQETDDDTESFRKGIVKEFSGNDSIFSRGLYSSGSEFIPMFKLCVVCNKIPRFIGRDPAIEERVRVCPFLSKWTRDAPDDPIEQIKTRHFKQDPHFETRLPLLGPALLWILTEYYPIYIKEGIRRVPIVEEYTKRYWHDQDFYVQYVEECLQFVYLDKDETDPDPAASITHMEIFRHFKTWFSESMPGNKNIPDSKTVKANFTKLLPDFKDKKWIGVRIVRDNNHIQA